MYTDTVNKKHRWTIQRNPQIGYTRQTTRGKDEPNIVFMRKS